MLMIYVHNIKMTEWSFNYLNFPLKQCDEGRGKKFLKKLGSYFFFHNFETIGEWKKIHFFIH